MTSDATKKSSLLPARTASPGVVAEHLRLNEKTIRRWCGREDYPCPHDRDDAGRITLNVDEVRDWCERTGTTGDVGRPDECGEMSRVTDGFWRTHVEFPPLPPLDPEWDIADLPESIYTAEERDIAEGRRTLTAAQQAEYVQRVARLRGHLADACSWLPSWLVGQSRRETAARMRAEVFDRLSWFAMAARAATMAAPGKHLKGGKK